MQTILLVMRRRAIAQELIRRLQDDASLQLIFEPDYTQAASATCTNNAYALLLEVAESGDCDILYCLDICARLRCEAPSCKLMLLCPEKDKAGAWKAVQAKREGEIDDFIFYDASIDYMVSKLSSL